MSDEDKQGEPPVADVVDSSGSSNGKKGFGLKFWRRDRDKRRLGSQDITMREHPGSAEVGDAGADASVVNGQVHEYRTYKRRWFGLVQLTLMNIVVSWDVSQSPLAVHRSRHAGIRC